MAVKQTHDFIISIEGIGSSGKTTQLGLLAESLRPSYNVISHKIINRKLLESVLSPLSASRHERIWVANLPEVEIGSDLLAFEALYYQRYSMLKAEVGTKPHIFIIERYLYSSLVHVAARAALKEIAKTMKSASSAPGVLAEVIRNKSGYDSIRFETLVEKYASGGIADAKEHIDAIYSAFRGARGIVPWPEIVFVLDMPVRDIKPREVKRENRAYTDGDILYYTVVRNLYKYVLKKEPGLIYLIDGTKEPEEISSELLKIVKRKCSLKDYRK